MEGIEYEPPKSHLFDKIILIFFGIAALLGWNALLTELDFFFYFLSDINPYRSFSFLNYFLNISFQFIIVWKKNLMSLNNQLIIGIIGSIIFLVLTPLFACTLGINTMINKVLTAGSVILMGFTNALASGGFFGYAGHFPLESIVLFTVGQGLSGIGPNIFQYIILATVKIDDVEKQYIVRAWIFFGINVLILLICLFLLFFSFRDEYCKYYINKANNIMPSSNNETRILKSMTNEESGETVPEDNNQQIQNIDQENMIVANPAPTFRYVFKKLMSYDLIACYGYIITFALFPNASIEQKLFDIGEYNSVTVIALYNAFDTIGRYLVKYLNPTKRKNFIIMIGRTILLFTIIFNYYLQEKTEAPLTLTSILLIINVVILGMTNGIGAAMTFGLAAESAEDDIKEQAGSSISFFSILGIFLGSCLAFATGAIIDTFKNKPNE